METNGVLKIECLKTLAFRVVITGKIHRYLMNI